MRARSGGLAPHKLQNLAATGLRKCPCGCRIATAVEMPCQHEAYALEPGGHATVHRCHCGQDHHLLIPHVVCRHCGASSGRAFVATAHTCRPATRPPPAPSGRHAFEHPIASPPRWV